MHSLYSAGSAAAEGFEAPVAAPARAGAPPPAAAAGPGVRTDIQSLRGIAVLLVLVYHSRFGLLPQGYLGVDVFFVISGFLITGMVVRDLDAGRFRFRDFYWRRAKRLLPAAYVVLLATSVAASLLLTRGDLAAYLRQATGVLLLCANVVLWKQTNYFETGVDTQPLLHTWSLSLEEQFYLVLPLALWLTPARLRRPALLAALVASGALGFVGASRHPTGTFYLLPTRAWELLLGCLGALWFRPQAAPQGSASRRVAGAAALAVMVALSLRAVDPVHPRLDAALVCLATLVAIWARPALLERGRLARGLSLAGDRSYSLYLVHWPILSFTRVVYLDAAPVAVTLLGLLASIAIAEALYRWIEDPLRRAPLRPSLPRLAVMAAAAALVLLLPAAALLGSHPVRDWADLRRPNYGLGPACDSGPEFAPTPACRTADEPRILVWGDSFAMHLVPGLVATDHGLGILQATRSECGPALGVAPLVDGKLASARDCLAFNDSVLDTVRRSPGLDYVVLGTSFELYVEPGARLLTPAGLEAAGVERAAAGMARAAAALRAAGRQVVVVGPPPSTGADLGDCLERLHSGLPVLGRALDADCSMDVASYRARRRGELDLVHRFGESARVPVVRIDDLLCDARRCRAQDEGTPLYLDGGHLSYAGSVLLARKHRLLQRLLRRAG